MNKTAEVSDFVLPWDHLIERRSFCRAIAALVLAETQRGNPRQILRGAWPDDARAALILRGAVSPTDTSSLPGQVAISTLRSLSPVSAAWRLFNHPSALRLSLDGIATISLPNTGQLPVVPTFVMEGGEMPVLQWALGKTTLGPVRKMAAIAAVSNELDNAGPESAAAVIGRILSDATARSIDFACFDANPASALRPAGLLFGASPINPSSAANPTDAMIEDLANLAGAAAGEGLDASDMVYVASAKAAAIIKLRAGPKFDSEVLASNGVPDKMVIGICPAGIASGYQGPVRVQTSRETLLHMEDTMPSPSSPSAKNMFQIDATAIRVIAECAWAAAPYAAQVVANVAWVKP